MAVSGLDAKYRLLTGELGFQSDIIKAALIRPPFNFDPKIHKLYSDVSAHELGPDFGYETGGKQIYCMDIKKEPTNNRCTVYFYDFQWESTGNSGSPFFGLGPSCGMIIYESMIGTIIGYIQFPAMKTLYSGGIFMVKNLQIRIIGR